TSSSASQRCPQPGQSRASRVFACGSSADIRDATASRVSAGSASASSGSCPRAASRMQSASRALAAFGPEPLVARSALVGRRKRTRYSPCSTLDSRAGSIAGHSMACALRVSSRRSSHSGQMVSPSTRSPSNALRSSSRRRSRSPTGRRARTSTDSPAAARRVSSRQGRASGLARSHASSSVASSIAIGGMDRSGGGLRERGLRRFDDLDVALPSLVLELEMLDRHRVRVGVQVRKRLELGDPATEHLVSDRELAGLVVQLDDDVLAEVLERHLGSESRAEVPHLVGPLLELGVVRDAALECERLELGAPRRFPGAGRIAAVAMLHHFRGPLEARYLAHPGDVAAVPLHAELEVLVGIEPGRVDAELCHRGLLGAQVWIWPASCWIWMITNSAGLSGAKPTRMLTTPRLMSSWVVVSLSHLTR